MNNEIENNLKLINGIIAQVNFSVFIEGTVEAKFEGNWYEIGGKKRKDGNLLVFSFNKEGRYTSKYERVDKIGRYEDE